MLLKKIMEKKYLQKLKYRIFIWKKIIILVLKLIYIKKYSIIKKIKKAGFKFKGIVSLIATNERFMFIIYYLIIYFFFFKFLFFFVSLFLIWNIKFFFLFWIF